MKIWCTFILNGFIFELYFLENWTAYILENNLVSFVFLWRGVGLSSFILYYTLLYKVICPYILFDILFGYITYLYFTVWRCRLFAAICTMSPLIYCTIALLYVYCFIAWFHHHHMIAGLGDFPSFTSIFCNDAHDWMITILVYANTYCWQS